MKFRVTFEVDASDTSYSIKDKDDEVSAVVMNLGSWLNTLHNHFLEQKVDAMFRYNDNPVMLKAVMEHIDDDIKLAKQLFNNLKVEGTMEDGNKFTFTHTEPGYKETMTFHPKE